MQSIALTEGGASHALCLPHLCTTTNLPPFKQNLKLLDQLCCRDEIMAARADTESTQRSLSRLLSQRAQHHGLVTGIAGQNPAFSLAARLAVRWVCAHMMAGVHLPVEAIELMLAAAFLPGVTPVAAPGSSSPLSPIHTPPPPPPPKPPLRRSGCTATVNLEGGLYKNYTDFMKSISLVAST